MCAYSTHPSSTHMHFSMFPISTLEEKVREIVTSLAGICSPVTLTWLEISFSIN